MAPSTTLLDYAVATDPASLYTTVDSETPSVAALTFTARNSGPAAVTIHKIQIDLEDTGGGGGQDAVNLIAAGSEQGISVSSPVAGPSGSSWRAISQGAVVTISPEPAGTAVTFQADDALAFTVRNVTIRTGATGTAAIEVFEQNDRGVGGAVVNVAIAQSTLTVSLTVVAADDGSSEVEQGTPATLRWQTNDATSGVLTIPGGSPSQIELPNATYGLEQGSMTVYPHPPQTTYTLTCQGRGPDVQSQATMSVIEVNMNDISVSPDFTVAKGQTVLLSWWTDAENCRLRSRSGAALVADGLPQDVGDSDAVPTTVPDQQYPKGYPVTVSEDVTYTLTGYKTMKSGRRISASKDCSLSVSPVSIEAFNAAPAAGAPGAQGAPGGLGVFIVVNAGDAVILTWQTAYATPNSVSIQSSSGGSSAQTSVVSNQPGSSDPKQPLVVQPVATTVYTLSCEGLGGPLSAEAKVYAAQPALGLDVLGRGSNVLAEGSDELKNAITARTVLVFSPARADQPIDPNDPGDEAGGYWIDPATDTAYLAPIGVRIVSHQGTPVAAHDLVYGTASEVADYYAEAAGLAAGGGAFGNAAPAREAAAHGQDNLYAIAERTTAYWSLELTPSIGGTSMPSLDPQFNKDLNALPSVFESTFDNLVQFRTFFTNYGTHIVSAVTSGIRVTGKFSVARSSASAELLTQDVVTSTMDRMVNGDVWGADDPDIQQTFMTDGGDPAAARQFTTHPFGDEEHGGYYPQWAATGPRNPALVGYTLRGIWELADPGRRKAIEDAYAWFALNRYAIAPAAAPKPGS